MYLKLLFKLILGYVRIEVEGYYVERFINICTNRKILIWNLKREKETRLYLNIGINDFKKLIEIAKKTNCRIKISKKKGMPFILNKYKKRKIFLIFLILMLVAIYVSSKYIWNIEILVENNLPIDNIEEDIKNLGIRKGILKDSINTDSIINELRLKRDDIAWIGIDIEGTKAKIKIVKADETLQIINNKDYSNIVASKSGIITKIIAQNGTANVKVGDKVQEGDILISGYMKGKYTEIRYVHSLGEIEAKVSYVDTQEVPLEEELCVYTGNIENKYELYIKNWHIRLYSPKSKYDIYEAEETEKKIIKNKYIPIIFKKTTNKEQKMEHKSYSIDEAINKGVQDLSEKMEKKIEDKNSIKDKKVKIKKENGSVYVTVIYEVLEKIGKEEKIQ